ncbi:MAG TPA: hypothetical protein VFM88_03165 [Vicinamibacteria bacterium]|nr:hypothetical protein [Vicinamibacteria bacterium]
MRDVGDVYHAGAASARRYRFALDRALGLLTTMMLMPGTATP